MPSPCTVPQVPADPGHPTPSKPQRARISEKKRRKARDLEQELLFLQAHYRFTEDAELVDLLQRAITEAHRLAQATRKSDRDTVLHVLETWEAAEIIDLEDETGLSRWVLDEILKEFKAARLIGERTSPDPADAGGRPRSVYFLLH